MAFVLEYMHMVCLGVVRHLMTFLMHGPKLCHLSVRQKHEIFVRLGTLGGKMPSEFARQPNGLHKLEQ